jgi:hypothetical protein
VPPVPPEEAGFTVTEIAPDEPTALKFPLPA